MRERILDAAKEIFSQYERVTRRYLVGELKRRKLGALADAGIECMLEQGLLFEEYGEPSHTISVGIVGEGVETFGGEPQLVYVATPKFRGGKGAAGGKKKHRAGLRVSPAVQTFRKKLEGAWDAWECDGRKTIEPFVKHLHDKRQDICDLFAALPPKKPKRGAKKPDNPELTAAVVREHRNAYRETPNPKPRQK